MYQFFNILDNVNTGFNNEEVTTTTIITMLLMVSVFSFYEFLVYRYVSKRSFYSKHFNISLAIIPFFIASIIMALQISLVVTLGTIGALAIIRFRTAVKDPLDMVYLFWSVHTGIVVGTGLFEVAFLTSIVVTVFILILDFMPLGKAPYLLVINIEDIGEEKSILDLIDGFAKHVNVKSRNFSPNGIDMIAEIRTKQEADLMKELVTHQAIKAASLVAHDGEKEF
ncbi:DUF4956 domain-containing protein [Alkalibacterium sp. s-m-22]